MTNAKRAELILKDLSRVLVSSPAGVADNWFNERLERELNEAEVRGSARIEALEALSREARDLIAALQKGGEPLPSKRPKFDDEDTSNGLF